VNASIRAVSAQIKDTEDELKGTSDPNEKDFLRQTLVQLRTKDQQLRAKELQLMEGAKQFPDAGTLPYPGALAVKIGLNEDVWAIMSQHVQERVLQLLKSKEILGAVKALSNMRADIDVEDAAKFGIEVLHSRDGKIQLGFFDVPSISEQVFFKSPPHWQGV
jgi:hypothetical protein